MVRKIQPLVAHKDFFNCQAKEFRNTEGQWQRGVVLAGLNRVDALARDLQFLRQIRLTPVALGA